MEFIFTSKLKKRHAEDGVEAKNGSAWDGKKQVAITGWCEEKEKETKTRRSSIIDQALRRGSFAKKWSKNKSIECENYSIKISGTLFL